MTASTYDVDVDISRLFLSINMKFMIPNSADNGISSGATLFAIN